MIEFSGSISENCKRFILNKTMKVNLISAFIVTIFSGIIVIILGALWDWIILIWMIVPLLMIIFSIITFKNPKKNLLDLMIPTKIYIKENDLVSENSTFQYINSIFNVKKVVDYGEWYDIQFYYKHRNPHFICQKNLITQGTIEEFEDLFKDKIIRKT